MYALREINQTNNVEQLPTAVAKKKITVEIDLIDGGDISFHNKLIKIIKNKNKEKT